VRILMFSHGYLPTLSGVTLVVQKIARSMVQRGHEVTVITASEKYLPYLSEDQGVILHRVIGLFNPFWAEGPVPIITPPAIRKYVERFQPDIIHSHDNGPQSYLLLWTRLCPQPRLITSCYTLPRFFSQYWKLDVLDPWMEKVMWKYYLSNLNKYEHVVFCTRSHQQDFLTHGLRPPTTVISNGVNIQLYKPEKEPGEDIESRFHLPTKPRILSVGRLMKDKKLDLLVRAMRVVCNERQAHLLVVGRGTELPHLRGLIQKLDLESNIHLLGYVREQDLPALYRTCDLFTIPSLVEVQSLPALQAAVSGLPIVGANSAAIPELVKDGKNGYLVNPHNARELGNAILRLLNNPDLARQMGQVSLEIGRAHDEQLTFQAYEDFYRSLVEQRNQAPEVRIEKAH
jgi:1,2-diacylglycerol 3-alpha-glucosyltransferase